MDYSSTYFGKPLNELVFQDIVNYFTIERNETDQLEFKSFSNLNPESYRTIIETISAFLNSSGGLLIWGAPIGKKEGKLEKIFQGNLTPINKLVGKDQIISKCSDSIVPLPKGIRLNVIENGNQECVCVFEIDESNYSPHQYNGKYMMRIDGQTKPAPHHYIEALFRKVKYPNLEGFIRFNTLSRNNDGYFIIPFDLCFFNWSPLQNVDNLSYHLVCHPGKFSDTGEGRIYRKSVSDVIHFGIDFVQSHVLKIHAKELKETNGKIDFLLIFGGQNTPSKSSVYALHLNDDVKANTSLEMYVTSRKENTLHKDHQDSNNVTRESILLKILGRQSE